MKRLWLFYFPLLFVPNIGLSHQTSFGVLEVSDWLIVPFIILLLLAPSARYVQGTNRLTPLLWAFLGWAMLSTLSIHFRFGYIEDVPILVGCGLKLAKLTLYAVASLFIARKLSDSGLRRAWLWSLLATLSVLSIGLLLKRGDLNISSTDALEGYKSYNTAIVTVAILSVYIAGLWIDNVGGRGWRRCGIIAVVLAVGSVLLSTSLTSHGRGGWVAFIAGVGYILVKKTQNIKIFAIIIAIGFASLTTYKTIPIFRSLVDATLSPTKDSGSESADGERISTWVHEAPKLINAPVLGTGFHHRGGNSGLWSTGSHNFFIQMFLETGIVGGTLVVTIFCVMWLQAGSCLAVRNRFNIATRSALIAAIVGGMSETYFYGSSAVLVLFAVLAAVDSLPRLGVRRLSFHKQRMGTPERVST